MADLPHLTPCSIPVISFPKSGRTWLRYAATLAGLGPDFEHAGYSTAPYELGIRFKGVPGDYRNRPVIFLHRNPIDTVVSYYFQIMRKDLIPGRKTWAWMVNHNRKLPSLDIDEFVRNPIYGIEKVLKFNKAWRKHSKATPGSLIVTYENFKESPHSEFKKFFTALGHPEIDCDWIVRETTFERMKEVQEGPDGPTYRLTYGPRAESAKVRRGVVRGYTNYLKPETILFCREMAAKDGINA